MVESSAEESAGKLSLGPREISVVSTGRSAASPETLEVNVCVVIPRGRRTPEDVYRRDLWSEDGEDSGVNGPWIEAVVPGEGWMSLLAVVVVSPTRLTRSAEVSAMAGKRRCCASTGDAERSVV